MEGYSPAGGTWSGKGVNSIGVFDPSVAGEGNHILTYSVQTTDCGIAAANKAIVVTSAPDVTLGEFSPVSVHAAPFALTGGTPLGGTYTGMGVSNGQFNPSVTGTGSFNMTYSFSDGGQCSGIANRAIVVISDLPAPTNLKGKAVSLTQINLTWLDNAIDETGYVIERSTEKGGAYVVLDTLPDNATSFADTGLTSGTVYYYKVKAIKSTENSSSYSNEIQVLADPLAIAIPQAADIIFNLYPNVVIDRFTVEFNTLKLISRVKISVVDISGVVLLEREASGNGGRFQTEFRVSELAAGSYLLKLTDGEEVFTKVFIKQ
jgi:hypothetical protein